MSKPKLSETMIGAIAMAHCAGDRLRRFEGGYWRGKAESDNWIGTATIKALVRRDIMEYTEWKSKWTGHHFAIEATLTAEYKAEHMTEIKYAESRMGLIQGPDGKGGAK